MRWFTRQRYEDPDFDEWDVLVKDYAAYLESIRSQLPDQLRLLADIDLHDAGVEAAEIDLLRRTARIRFLTFGSQRLITCRYEDADFGNSNIHNLEYAIEAIIPKRDSEGHVFGWTPLVRVLSDEVTVEGDRFQHALVLQPFGDFAVTFRGFTLTAERGFEPHSRETKERFRVINEFS
ncbi:MAG TPA: hypothetical protein VM674_07005 [Candidatus Acidoferrum sp.]|nr:hypothetical protein [Candidatus Acidoferrum sp.]